VGLRLGVWGLEPEATPSKGALFCELPFSSTGSRALKDPRFRVESLGGVAPVRSVQRVVRPRGEAALRSTSPRPTSACARRKRRQRTPAAG